MVELQSIYKHLLDLGKRNRLLNFKDSGFRSINILNKNIDKLFDNIISFKELSILPLDSILKKYHDSLDSLENDNEYSSLKVYDIASVSLKDNELICYKEGQPLNKVLKRLYQEYKFSIDEKGINSLYIAFGFITYIDLKVEYKAPLLLIPIDFYKKNEIYKIKAKEEEAILNPTLEYYYKQIKNREIPKYNNEESINSYFEKIKSFLNSEETFINSSALGLFFFQKMNMYMDLKQNNDIVLANKNIRRLLGDDVKLDSYPLLPHYPVVDFDSSQLEAIDLALTGTSFCLEGPPGSGKSQTITNIIASLIGNGKKVLFVSEKQAALNVVYENLKKAGLNEFALELHSNKANKKDFINEVYKTAILPKYNVQIETLSILDKHEIISNEIRDYYNALHNKYINNKYSIYDLYNQYLKIDLKPIDIRINFEDYPISKIDEICEELDTYSREVLLFKTNDYKSIPLYGLINLNHDYIEYNISKDINDSLFYLEKIKDIIKSIDFIRINNHTINSVNSFYWAMDYCHLLTKLSKTPACYFNKGQRNDLFILLNEYQNINNNLKNNNIISLYDSLVFDLDLKNIYIALNENKNSLFKSFNKDYKQSLKKIMAYRREYNKENIINEVRELINIKDAYNKKSNLYNKISEYIPNMTDNDIEDSIEDIKELNLKNEYKLLRNYNDIKNNILDAVISYKRYNNEYFSLERLSHYFNPEVIDLMHSEISIVEIKLKTILEYKEQINNYLYLGEAIEKIKKLKLNDFIDKYSDLNLDLNKLSIQFKKNYLHSFLLHELDESPTLYHFREKSFKDKIEEYKILDKKLEDINISTIISKNSMKRPDDVVMSGSSFKVLAKEYNKTKRQKPIRLLLDEIFDFILDIKPVFLMSPLSVSTYLENKNDLFDCVIFDEASQIFIHDSLGAIYRSKQCIIIGDSKQMPPSNFFNASDSSDEDDDEYNEDTNDSILSYASLNFISHSLKWHYRSRSEELIAFSNNEFYNNSLITIPSASIHKKGLGIDYVYINDGVYDLKTRTNRKEAEYIANLIIDHYRNSELSLGVVAFSNVQRELISDVLDEMLKKNNDVKRIIENITNEPLFIKNLETVQGDERDRIIFSICYGHNEYNKFYQRFGPLNALGGEKRLNVAITRAKYNITVVSSIHSFELTNSNSLGANSLKKYLQFAENASKMNSSAPSLNGVVLSVKSFLENKGYIVDTNYGSSSFKIDLAVKLPNNENYSLAIMIDKNNPSLISDEARLKEGLLERAGFKYYKLYTPAWVNERKLIEEELIELLSNGISNNNIVSHESYLEESEEDFSNRFNKYNEISILEGKDILNSNSLDYLIYKIVEREEPITKDYLYRKIAYILDKTRVSNVIKNMVNPLLKDIYCENNILFLTKKESNLRISSDRGIDEIPLSELMDGIYKIIKENQGITITGCYKILLNILEFKRLTENTKKILDDAVVMLKLDGKIIERDSKLYS